ncbi:SPO22-domain-containing protein [Polychaeton citri CBS 116435]|uniref:SPO22-domain-containing protein n=1 Tax=Polychaeton citri CBS 116435 TaxID=1314669 RepID=A0A9P4Q765_9PEZI|nr:SPO22-domain-containing protein [Polychaeton citri CBS 116435]
MVGFASKTAKLLQNRVEVQSSLTEDVATQLAMFPLAKQVASSGRRQQLDQLGIDIWNAAANLVRYDQSDVPTAERDRHTCDTMHDLSSTLKVFAYFLIDAAYQCSPKPVEPLQRVLRVLRIALKAVSACLGRNKLALSLKVLGDSANYIAVIEAVVHPEPCNQAAEDVHQDFLKIGRQLVLDYHLSRILHSWKADDIGLADFFARKIAYHEFSGIPCLTKQAVELYTSIARHLANELHYSDAVGWLTRAEDIIVEDSIPVNENLDSYLDVVDAQVDCTLEVQSSQCRAKALELLKRIEDKACGKGAFPIQLTRFRITAKTASHNASELLSDLLRMIREAFESDSCCKTILQAANFLKQRNSLSACKALQQFLNSFLIKRSSVDVEFQAKGVWLERTLITLTVFAFSPRNHREHHFLDLIEQCYDDVERSASCELSYKAAHAVQTLIWKSLDTADWETNEKACKLLSHPIFSNASTNNNARIARKAMTVALESDELEIAHQAYRRMPEAHRDDLSSRYLAFKLGLRSQDFDFARDCLEIVAMQSSQHPDFLYACIIEAHKSGYQEIAILALSALVDLSPTGIHLPALLRCTAQMLLAQSPAIHELTDNTLDTVIGVFENAAARIDEMRHVSGDLWPLEVQWWVKTTYHLSLQSCASAHPQVLIRLLQSCVRFIDSIPAESDVSQARETQKRRVFCIFFSTSAHIMLGRVSPNLQSSAEHFLQAQQQLRAFASYLNQEGSINTDDDVSKWTFELLKFDLECAIRLEQWDRLDEILKRCVNHGEGDRWDVLADLVILLQHKKPPHVGSASSANIPKLLQKAINSTWSQDRNVPKVARWIRIAFSICSDDNSGDVNGELGIDLVKQAAAIARRGREEESGDMIVYPEAELLWLAAVAFNRAVDCLDGVAGYKEARRWADAALELAY